MVAEGIGLVADPSSALDYEPVEAVLERLIRRFGVIVIRSRSIDTAMRLEGRSDRSQISDALLGARYARNSTIAGFGVNDLSREHPHVTHAGDPSEGSGESKWTANQKRAFNQADARTRGCAVVGINDPTDPLSQAAFEYRISNVGIPAVQDLGNVAVARVEGSGRLVYGASGDAGHSEHGSLTNFSLARRSRPCIPSGNPAPTAARLRCRTNWQMTP